METPNQDKTEGSDVVNYKVDSEAGTASATTQKKVKDDDADEASLVGDPTDLALTADEQAAFIKGCDGVLTSILAARTPAASPAPESQS